jgi:carboxyl-terminal processing protease
VLAILIFGSGVLAGFGLATYSGQRPPEEVSREAGVLWRTLSLLQGEYYGRPLDSRQLVYAAIRGMVQSVGDEYTVFLPPQQAEEVRRSFEGNYEGIGIFVELRNGLPTVVSPIPGTPADRAGLQPGDAIVAVDGRPTKSLPLDQVISWVRGPSGTRVTLTVQRPGQFNPFDVTLTRQRITAPAVLAQTLDHEFAYLRLTVFNERTVPELDKALSEALGAGRRGIVLDLRNNGGGFVDSAQQTLGRFLEGGVAFYEDSDPGQGGITEMPVKPGGTRAYKLPMVVLVNSYTASAAEIVAGALQDYGRATLIGERTFGKGTVQRVHDFEDGSSLRITVAHWLTPSKRDITAQGIMPDLILPLQGRSFPLDEDPHVLRAVEFLRTGK